MNRLIPVLLALTALALVPMFAVRAGEHKDADHADHKDGHNEAAATIELTGEVIDMTCYFAHPDSGQGEEHAQCAESCISKGLPAGLLVDKTLYLLVGTNHKAVNDKVAPHAGRKATLVGEVKEMNGMKALIVESVKP